jgi:hypothetical protein
MKKFIAFFCLLSSLIFSQNLDKLGEKNALLIQGGIQYNSVFYLSNAFPQRREPFVWYFTGNLSFTLLDWNIPFSYAFSNKNQKFTQPFNQYGIHPQYKNIKLHLGYQNPTFSSYTINGHNLLGAGIEYNPQHFFIHAVYGRLKRASQFTIGGNNDEISFRRMGGAIKAGINYTMLKAEISLFHGADDIKSLDYIPPSIALKAEENICSSIKVHINPVKFWNVEIEGGISKFIDNESELLKKSLKNLNNKSGKYYAGKLSSGMHLKQFQINLIYERTEPGFRSLGSYFFMNDFENIQLSPQINLIEGRLSFGGSIGVQRNNLYNIQRSGTWRNLSSLNLSYRANKYYSVQLNYSNLNSVTKNRISAYPFQIIQPEDTMYFQQISKNASLNQQITFKSKSCLHQFSTSLNALEAKQIQYNVQQTPQVVMALNAIYTINQMKKNVQAGILFNYNNQISSDNILKFFGPGIQFGKSLINSQMKINIGAFYNINTEINKNKKEIYQYRLQWSYQLKLGNKKYGKPNIGFNACYIHKPKSKDTGLYNELTIMTNLGWFL